MNFRLKKGFIILLLLLTFSLLFAPSCLAGSNRLNELNYDVTLNTNGTADVVETWNIRISDTNTLFKTFVLDSSKYSGISNVSVVETTDGMNKAFTQLYTEQYHVTKNCFYALPISGGKFEIAWGVSEDNSTSTRSFKIRYTIKDAIKNYADCSEFYWKFLDTSNGVPADFVTGTIHLPNKVSNLEDFKVWAHGPLNGVISKQDNSTATFKIEDLDSEKMLEVRVVTPSTIFLGNSNISSKENLSNILSQEQSWADSANRQRMIQNIIFIASVLLGLGLTVFFIFKIVKYIKIFRKTPKIVPSQTYGYYRDFPDELAAPGEVSFVYSYYTSSTTPAVISASILDLCLKGYLSFEEDASKKKEIWIKLNKEKNISTLPKEEQEIFMALSAVNEKYKNTSGLFNMNDFKKYFSNNSSKFTKLFENVYEESKKSAVQKGKCDSSKDSEINKFSGYSVLYLVVAILNLFFLPMAISYIPLFVLFGLSLAISGRLRTLTPAGVDEKEKLKALKNFMLNFSNMKEKEVPELVLWEKYLVYATVFGIADKVISQLKVVYPQMMDENYMFGHNYTYLYFMCHTNNFGLVNSINTGLTNTYSNVYSSGSGGGGGFSGGGGGGGGGGRYGWKIIFYYLKKLYFLLEVVLFYLKF